MRRLRFWRRHDEIPVVELSRANPVKAGVILIIAIALVVYFGFTKKIPFKHGYTIHAEFTSAQDIHPKSPVRVAGVDVGTVTSIKRQGNTGLVTMEIESKGLPIHSDATMKIRPRIFLEGNWFVDMQPGSPSAPDLSSGATIPVTQTADPVQLDQVLDALNTSTIQNLQHFLIYYGQGLTAYPTPKENAEQDPEARGINAAQALNKTYRIAPPSLQGTAVVQQAFGGVTYDDLSKLIASIGKVTGALNVHEQALGELIVNFNTFFAAFAANSKGLTKLVSELPRNLTNIKEAFVALESSFGPTQTFAHEIIPGVELTNPTVAATLPWIKQVQASLAPNELGGVASGLVKAVPPLAQLESEQVPFYEQTDEFNKCLTNDIIPAGNTKLQDGSASSGVEDYKEFWYSLVGLNGLGQSFDGNGSRANFLVGNSGQTLRSKETGMLGFPKLKGNRLLTRSPLTPLGTRPAYPSEEPPYKPKVPCYKQKLPDFNGPLANGPADGSP
jgi:phospholipid/cholesterol/gamma-HCH transport system substrate-binding protein